MEYFLGFDGGGTKTECVLMDADGQILAESRAGPSNPLRSGFERTFTALSEAATGALAARQLSENRVTGICAGIAGAGRADVVDRVEEFFRHAFPHAAVRVTTDLEIALETAAGSDAGLVLIAGTGSAAYGRNVDGKTARAGGEGPQKGDLGSAFDIGRRVWKMIVSGQGGLAQHNSLVDRIYETLGSGDPHAIAQRITENPDDVFPKLFPLVAEAAEMGDPSAREILTGAAGALARLAAVVVEKLDLVNESFILARVGGVFGKSSILDSAVDAQLARIAPKARIERLSISAARGAAEIARRAAKS
jgi:N-acetylglucosamine kinase-like BadF-type ATPase